LRWPPAGRLLPFALGALTATGVTQLLASRTFEVAKPSENIRSQPEGKQIGTLLEGATIEEAGRDGKWVKFRLEAWIWGPSLEGYEAESATATVVAPTTSAASQEESAREARPALSVHLAEVRDLIDDRYGSFYGMRIDPDLNQVQVRFRVRDIEPEALARRHMRVQHAVFELLSGEVEFESLRIETNRADGSGEVGVELSTTSADGVERVGGEDFKLWSQITRRSSDGGATWTEPE
jgi:hypothetical protein